MDERRQEDGIEALVSRFGAYFFDEDRHRASLPMMATWLAAAGRHREALALLDRYWRTGHDGVPDRILQASILRTLGGPAAGLPALRRAIAIDPANPAAIRSLLATLATAGHAQEAREVAARVLVRADEPDLVATALEAQDPRWQVHGAVRMAGSAVEGWCVWRGDAACDLVVLADGRRTDLSVARRPHPDWNAKGVSFGSFAMPWPGPASMLDIRVARTGQALAGAPLVRDDAPDRPGEDRPAGLDVTVIVPVYGDPDATRACFDALLTDGTGLRRRIIVVDDASPDPAVRALADRFAGAGQVELIRNPHNIGFIRAVNRALRRVGTEDVVLLNADTIVPPLWLDRLAAVAAGPGVGTVTPLSNNGELVSLPAPFAANPLPARDRIVATDAAARRLGAGAIDLPNGNGFCLYITNAAFRAAGALDGLHYERGYLEEVDFCLRVAQAGYRNVCATDVYLGHLGQASFGDGKAPLVSVNAATLVRRWPLIEMQTQAFMTADPLRGVRDRLALATLDPAHPRRLVLGSLQAGTPVLGRLAQDAPGRDLVTLAMPTDDPGSWAVTLRPAADAPAGPTREGASWPGWTVPLPDDIRALSPPDALRAVVSATGCRDAVAILDQGLSAVRARACADLDLPLDVLPVTLEDAPWAAAQPLLARCRRILVTTQALAAVAGRRVSRARDAMPGLVVLPLPATGARAARHRAVGVPAVVPAPLPEHLGLVPPDASAATFAAVRDLARSLLRRGSRKTLVVLGETFRDVGLFRLGNVFVTGPVDPAEGQAVADLHGLSGLVLPVRMPGWGLAACDLLRSVDLPWAAFPDGEAGDLLEERPGGVRLDPAWSMDRLAAALDAGLFASTPAREDVPA